MQKYQHPHERNERTVLRATTRLDGGVEINSFYILSSMLPKIYIFLKKLLLPRLGNNEEKAYKTLF